MDFLTLLKAEFISDIKTMWQNKWMPFKALRAPKKSTSRAVLNIKSFLEMAAKPVADSDVAYKKIPLKLASYYLIFRIIALLLGVHMQTSHLEHMMHIMDIELIKNDFWFSLWHMHAQPPLFNIMAWVVVKLAPFGQYWLVALPMFVAMGVSLLLVLYHTQLRLGIPTYWAAAIAFLFSISANSLYYASYFLYGLPIALLLATSVLYLLKFKQSPSFKSSSVLFFCLLGVCLLHSLFHLVFYVFAMLFLFIFIGRGRLKILSGALIPLALLCGIYAKNYVHTGQFAASTWGGWTISNVMMFYSSTIEEKKMLIDEGLMTENCSVVAFEPVENYPNLDIASKTGVELLDALKKSNGDANLQHQSTNNLSKESGTCAIATLKAHPEIYLKGVQAALYIFLMSPSEWFYTRSKILTAYWDYPWSALTTGKLGWSAKSQSQYLRERWKEKQDMPTDLFDYIQYNGWYNFPWLTPIILLILVGYGLKEACKGLRTGEGDAIVFWFMLFIIGYVTTTSILLDVGENQRYRYYMSPMLATIFGLMSFKIWKSTL